MKYRTLYQYIDIIVNLYEMCAAVDAKELPSLCVAFVHIILNENACLKLTYYCIIKRHNVKQVKL